MVGEYTRVNGLGFALASCTRRKKIKTSPLLACGLWCSTPLRSLFGRGVEQQLYGSAGALRPPKCFNVLRHLKHFVKLRRLFQFLICLNRYISNEKPLLLDETAFA